MEDSRIFNALTQALNNIDTLTITVRLFMLTPIKCNGAYRLIDKFIGYKIVCVINSFLSLKLMKLKGMEVINCICK